MKLQPTSASGTALLVAGGLLVAVAATAFVGAPDEVVREHPEQLEPVVRATSVCPYAGGEARASSYIGVLTLPGVAEPAWVELDDADDEDGPPPVAVRRLAGPDDIPDPLLTIGERGASSRTEVEGSSPASYAVQAEGPLAPGIVAEQYMLAQGPGLRGVVTAPCTPPAREHWFVGASATSGNRGRLVMTNPNATPAVVTVSLWNATGPVDAPGTKDISIPAYSNELLVLDAFAPNAEEVGVWVRASQGQVAAALDYRETDDGKPLGISMVPPAATPSTSLVIPGVPGHGERTLHILAPGDADAIVAVKVLGPDGVFSPLGHDVVTVPAGGVARVPLSEAIGDSAAAIALESDEDITAAVRVVDSGDDQLRELAYTAAADPLPAGPAAVVLSRADSTLSSRLLLTAVDEPGGRVTVTVLDDDGAVSDEQVVDVAAGSTVELELAPGEDAAWATAIVEPGASGNVVVARELVGSDDDGRLLDLMPVLAPALTVPVPTVVSELPTGLKPPGRTETEN